MTRERAGPTLLGIGAQKCATSWVHAVLGAHPQVGVSRTKELDFFGARFDRGYRWYEAAFETVSGRPVRFECSPSYLGDPRVPGRVRAYRGEMRLVAMLRNPVERAYSNHLHEVVKGHIAPMSFEAALETNPAYLEQGLYGRHLARWRAVFPAAQICVMLSEQVADDPVGAASALYRFAGVDAGFRSAVALEHRNRSDRARSPSLRRMLRGGGDALRGLGLEESLARIKRTAPVAAVLRANTLDLRAVVPPLRQDTRAGLVDYYADDVKRLCRLMGWADGPWPDWSWGERRPEAAGAVATDDGVARGDLLAVDVLR